MHRVIPSSFRLRRTLRTSQARSKRQIPAPEYVSTARGPSVSHAHPVLKPLTTARPIASSMLPNSHYTRDPDINENGSVETPSLSDGEVDLQYILPRSSLGQVDRQRIFELRLRKLVRTFIYLPRTTTNPFFVG